MSKIPIETIEFFKKTRQLTLKRVILWNEKEAIGWETPVAFPYESMTKKAADQLLTEKLLNLKRSINKVLLIKLTPNQYTAVLSLVYDIGIVSFKHSLILKYLNSGSLIEANSNFMVWNKFYKRPIYKLAKRRKMEMELFFTA